MVQAGAQPDEVGGCSQAMIDAAFVGTEVQVYGLPARR